MLDGWKGVVVVLASFALLGALVYLKVPEAAVAAVAVVQIIVAWVAKPPAKGPGASLVPFAAAGAVAALLGACTPLTPQDRAAIAQDAVRIGVCQAEAHACKEEDGGAAKCWGVYDTCLDRAGLTQDGGR